VTRTRNDKVVTVPFARPKRKFKARIHPQTSVNVCFLTVLRVEGVQKGEKTAFVPYSFSYVDPLTYSLHTLLQSHFYCQTSSFSFISPQFVGRFICIYFTGTFCPRFSISECPQVARYSSSLNHR